MEMETKAYYYGLGGIEIKDILYGIEDYVVFVAEAWTTNRSVHKVRIYYGNTPYFIYHGYRIRLGECIRTN